LTDVASSPVALPPGQTCLVLTGNSSSTKQTVAYDSDLPCVGDTGGHKKKRMIEEGFEVSTHLEPSRFDWYIEV